MQVIADLHIHSRFSRAVSKEMTVPNIAAWARRKGIGLVAAGDWTHPLWFREIQANLEEVGNGLLKLNSTITAEVTRKSLAPSSELAPGVQSEAGQNFAVSPQLSPFFLLSTEISCIYSQNGKSHRVHTLVWLPSFAAADKINKEMTKQGCNLMSDGRPIIGLTSIQLAELVLTAEPKALVIPAHAWTPWFSLYGAMSGFDSIDEAFGKYARDIYAVETGLSSNPSMNWQVKELDSRQIISNSDAHSGPKLGRETTVFELEEPSFENISQAVKGDNKTNRIAYTIEFYPEEGKYHYTGHRACNIRLSPAETKKKGSTCPVCGKPLTIGVMHRVEDLAGRSEADLKLKKVKIPGTLIEGTASETFPNRPPFVMLVPLQEIISESIGSPVTSPKVQSRYMELTDKLGGEFPVLLNISIEEIKKAAGDRIAAGIEKTRKGDIVIEPGYDGVFGVVKIWKEGEEKPLVDSSKEQLSIF